MPSLDFWIRVAGFIQVLDAAVNVLLPRKIKLRESLQAVSPLVRQIFVAHWGYVIYILAAFGVLCWFFAPELAGVTPLGRFGFTTGRSAGVVTRPWRVSSTPMRPRPSRSFSSNTRGDGSGR